MRLGNRRLAGDEIRELRDALRDAFSLPQDFDDLLLFRLDISRPDISTKTRFVDVVVIRHHDDRARTAELLAAARAERHDNDRLVAFAAPFGLAPAISLVRTADGSTERSRLEATRGLGGDVSCSACGMS